MFFERWMVNRNDLVKCVSVALKIVSPDIARHHNQVAYISYRIAALLGLSEEEVMDITVAAALHDIGAVSLEEKLDSLRFENSTIHNHAQLGFLFLNKFDVFKNLAPLVRYHHYAWNNGKGKFSNGEPVPIGSHIIHLADRVAILIEEKDNILSQKYKICEYLKSKKGSIFNPELVDVFMEVAEPECFWLDCASELLEKVLENHLKWKTVKLNIEQITEYSRFLSRIVDFRSPLNANHSSGVAASAAMLAHLVGFSNFECSMMLIAGYLHDVGKLAVPVDILEKEGSLNEAERSIINSHPYFTYHILANIKEFETINTWASFHHERLDGKGYPFKIKENNLPLGSQIMAVADIYTALNEERTYRKAMSHQDSIKIMNDLVKNKAINGDLLALLDKNFAEINKQRQLAQQVSAEEYSSINPLFIRKKTASVMFK